MAAATSDLVYADGTIYHGEEVQRVSPAACDDRPTVIAAGAQYRRIAEILGTPGRAQIIWHGGRYRICSTADVAGD